MPSVCSFVEEEYIDLDLSSCGEFEFQVRQSGGAADELLCRGRLAAATPPPHKAAPPRPGGKVQEVDAGSGGFGGGAGRRSAATVAPLQHSHSAAFRDAQSPVVRLRKECSRRRKAARTVHAKLLASRAFFRSLFARTSCSDEQCRGADVRPRATPSGEAKSGSCRAPFGQIRNGYYHSSSGRAAPTTLRSSIEQEKLMDEEDLAAAAVRQRKSFSGVIKWRHATTTAAAAPAAAAPPAKPLSSSSARRSSGPALKRSSSVRSESEGLIQGAIAYCKRSQQQLGLARKSVSDAALCSAPSSWSSNPARSSAVAYCH
ncbi:hypothetical protein BAE44_0026153 [Dichanthelium oligosanthes]|uniref:Uncharacterized protein n=1 Tax=Dichanthelium oligosanthes TaxID=888268 RepID=A0A1E5UIY4_9POAL|nr:hypothetical protein BAE44_0026153 [Dichanthelium oligosanthes]